MAGRVLHRRGADLPLLFRGRTGSEGFHDDISRPHRPEQAACIGKPYAPPGPISAGNVRLSAISGSGRRRSRYAISSAGRNPRFSRCFLAAVRPVFRHSDTLSDRLSSLISL